MLLIKVSPKQRTANAAGYRAERPSAYYIPKQGTTGTAGNSTDRAVAATTFMAIVAAVTAVGVMMSVMVRILRERRCRHDDWPGNQCGQGGHR